MELVSSIYVCKPILTYFVSALTHHQPNLNHKNVQTHNIYIPCSDLLNVETKTYGLCASEQNFKINWQFSEFLDLFDVS